MGASGGYMPKRPSCDSQNPAATVPRPAGLSSSEGKGGIGDPPLEPTPCWSRSEALSVQFPTRLREPRTAVARATTDCSTQDWPRWTCIDCHCGTKHLSALFWCSLRQELSPNTFCREMQEYQSIQFHRLTPRLLLLL